MADPYRVALVEPAEARRTLDPWKLALLFAWVCDIGRVGLGLLGDRSVTGELGFAGLLAVTTMIVFVTSLRKPPR
jgi:hypothetical protein